MKRYLLALLIACPFIGFSQTESEAKKDTTYWKKGGAVSLTANATTLANWSAGGVDSWSGGSFFNYFFDFKKGSTVWKNTIDMGFGFIQESGSDLKKADDRIILTSQYGSKIGESKWYYNAMLDFRTQFAEGYNVDDPDNYISKFMAPGYLLATIGFDYKPTDYFDVSIGPLSGKTTFVMDQRLADLGSFGVEGADRDNNGVIIAGTGQQVRYEFGATVKASFNKEIMKNTTLVSNLLLFSNYMKNPEKIDVNWENALTLKVNDFFSASVFLQTIYDYDIKFYENDINGDPDLSTEEDRWQFKSVVGLGLSYKFGAKRS
ncbi:DUF3078 domain-containing protein [Reichenbachiella ulvae]|uniref:DUF3078 domain-containing protein n=1 Tax=Reichenbachiella ulvae TaxID=2980104 RepID=A0ABT3CVU7_9BACT|nr:DUF3078 domain-containing protein [Reichenbachiella ulvae]MCV9387691.1 DUF3078 domain-containing protein [Reichenbachiella ulvae]